jgi:6-pyruvoyltetrahydropterin/6-carboxytetrahydropterin synthase
MIVELTKTFHFEAAHALTAAPEGHRCRQIHGHTYQIEVTVEGPVNPKHGWFMDYGDIVGAVKPVLALLDHKMLNEIEGLEIPTSEHLCKWIWDRILHELPGLKEIVVQETPTSRCRFRGRTS